MFCFPGLDCEISISSKVVISLLIAHVLGVNIPLGGLLDTAMSEHIRYLFT